MVRNEACPECKHHMLEHVLSGEHGVGCQAKIGELDGPNYAYCNCEHYHVEFAISPFEAEP